MKKKKLYKTFIIIAFMSVSLTMRAMDAEVPGPNRAPLAKAGWDQTVAPYETVAFDGSESIDPDGDKLSYHWELVAAPDNGLARLTGARGFRTCRLVPDKPGVWMVRLTVCDGKLSGQDVMQIRVQEESAPNPVPDLEITDLSALGISRNTNVKEIKVSLKTGSGIYRGPLDLRIIGLDKLQGGHFTFDKTVTIEDICLNVNDGIKSIALCKNEINWPEDICNVTFAATVDPENKIEEINEQNNFFEKTIYRDELLGKCAVRIFPEMIRIGKANLRPAPINSKFIFPADTVNVSIPFRNCCPAASTFKLAIIYDWTLINGDGENKKIWESVITVKPAENNPTMITIKIPKKREFKTLAIRREHEKGYDILYTVDVRVDY